MFLRQWAERFHKAERTTLSVCSLGPGPGSTVRPLVVMTRCPAASLMAVLARLDTAPLRESDI